MGQFHRRLLINRLWKWISIGGSLSKPPVQKKFPKNPKINRKKDFN
jgi:hypothetical protein